jgi:farnesyl-diphosphate farnesyltransferase
MDGEMIMSSPPTVDLGTTILKGVSRSFYLSLRFLPAAMREGTSLGYLLARMSDTIADTTGVAVVTRLELLDDFYRAVQLGGEFFCPNELSENCVVGEKILLEKVNPILSWLCSVPAEVAALIRAVIADIISGQRLDLVRFGNASANDQMLLHDDHELYDYCDRVAGSVGEFWTRLGLHCYGNDFCDQSTQQMIEWGRSFGKGLQLVNILRDLPEDVKAGRYYLPDSAVNDLMALHRQWCQRAEILVQSGLQYAHSLKMRRIRSASVLPALLALETLEKMHDVSWSRLSQRVKVTRSTVFRCFVEAVVF